MTITDLVIASPRTYRFLGGYMRIGMPLSAWRTWATMDWRAGDVRVHGVFAGSFFAWMRVEADAQSAARILRARWSTP